MQATAVIGDKPTDFIINVYADRVFIIITQTGKPGTLVHVSRDQGAGGAGGKTMTTRVLIGKRDDYVLVYAKKIGEMVASRTSKPLLLALCVLSDSPDVFRAVLQVHTTDIECDEFPNLSRHGTRQALAENCIW
jgi:proteasome assembly chaperone 3